MNPLTSPEADVLQATAIERERKRGETGWCCRVVHPNGSMPVNLYNVTRGVVEEAVLAAVHAWPDSPARGYIEPTRVSVWREPVTPR